MLKIRYYLLLCFLFGFQIISSQSVELLGKVQSKTNVENIHVINNTAQIFTTTSRIGEFKIYAKPNDTIVFSSIQHMPKQIVVTQNILKNG